jgi:UDP-N-acetylglucosamine acyltransferase
MEIHPTAVVSKKACLAEGVVIGPYSIIGDHVSIGEGTEILSHVVIEGLTTIGRNNRIYPFVTLGTPPQDIGYRGEATRLIVGDNNIIREYATIHRATTKEQWETRVGDDNYLMAYVHIAHDCRVGNGVIMANATTLGGHVIVGDKANIGGLTAIHQFVRVGAYAFIGGMTAVDKDIPPFMLASGHRATLYGPNRKGLARQGFSKDEIEDIKAAYRIIWRESAVLEEGVARVKREIKQSRVREILLNFLEKSKRGIAR